MPIVKELPVIDQRIVLDRDVLAQVGLTTGRATLVVDGGSIVIRPAQDSDADTEGEDLIQRIIKNSGRSRQEIERFLAVAGAWANDDEPISEIQRLRREMDA